MASFMPVAYGTVVAFALIGALKGPPAAPDLTPAPRPPVAATGGQDASGALPTSVASIKPATAPEPSLTAAMVPVRTPWVTPDADKLPDDTWGRTVRYGRDLIVKTYALIGPEIPDAAHRFSGNNMSCQNCHLEAGTKQFGLPFQGVYADFPNYRARSGTVGTIEDRIQGCMTRSMNGKPLPPGGPEMTAMVAYMKFLSTGRPVGEQTSGRGPGKMPEMSRPADPVHGKEVYAQTCVACHGADGMGKRVGDVGDAKGYTFPPLWGEDSFNDGAGMDRVIGAANFIHNNMPNGVNWNAPVIPEQDAWDVAAFVQSQPRAHKPNLDRDYPMLLEKPVDTGYGPYPDGFSQDQHRFGPFFRIRARIKQMLAAVDQEIPKAKH